MISRYSFFFFVLVTVTFTTSLLSQGSVYGFLAGPTLSSQNINGFNKEPFLRYHALVFIESTSEINPNSLYARFGYHLKGSAVNFGYYYDNTGMEHPPNSYNMEFHNISLSLGVKQRREIGEKHFSYGLGLRGDYNLDAKYGIIFSGLEGTQNYFTYGFDVDVGIELPLSELVSVQIELGVSPDLSNQIFIPQQDTDYTYDDGSQVIIPETNLTNVVFELRAGFRFWHKIIYTD